MYTQVDRRKGVSWLSWRLPFMTGRASDVIKTGTRKIARVIALACVINWSESSLFFFAYLPGFMVNGVNKHGVNTHGSATRFCTRAVVVLRW